MKKEIEDILWGSADSLIINPILVYRDRVDTYIEENPSTLPLVVVQAFVVFLLLLKWFVLLTFGVVSPPLQVLGLMVISLFLSILSIRFLVTPTVSCYNRIKASREAYLTRKNVSGS